MGWCCKSKPDDKWYGAIRFKDIYHSLKYKYQHLAARFAAKEAVYKALATGWNKDVGWQNIEISNEPNGMPIVNLHGKLKKFLSNDKNLKISMSHSRDYVTCMAIVYKNDLK